MKFNISIDDFCSMPGHSFELWDNVESLINIGAKIDVFVTFAMRRNGRGPYRLLQDGDILKKMKEYEDIVHFNVHGFHHGWKDSNNDEFYLADEDYIKDKLCLIDEVIDMSGVRFYKVFRPPAWRINQFAVDLLKEHNYTHLSLYGGYEDRYDIDTSGIKVHWCDYSPPINPLPSIILADVSVMYHFGETSNSLNSKNTKDLISYINRQSVIRNNPSYFYISDQ